ncbi:MAG: MFS transporter small subunit [Gemmatimonadaceae bacterium]
MTNNQRSSSTLIVKLITAWTLVGVPLAWGVWQVFKKSLDLFK